MANQKNSTDTLHEPLAPDRTALLVIDMQRYFVRPEHIYGKSFMKGDSERSFITDRLIGSIAAWELACLDDCTRLSRALSPRRSGEATR